MTEDAMGMAALMIPELPPHADAIAVNFHLAARDHLAWDAMVSNPTTKRRILYLVGTKHPVRFLHNNRTRSSVLKDAPTAARVREVYGDRFQTVGQYFATVRDLVEIVDLAGLVPGLGTV